MTVTLPENIETALRAYREALDRQVRRGIDAATCGTSHDWRRATDAEAEAEAAEDALRAAIASEVRP